MAISKICNVCLSEDHVLNICADENKPELNSLISLTKNTELHIRKHLYICQKCCHDLENYERFRQLCYKNLFELPHLYFQLKSNIHYDNIEDTKAKVIDFLKQRIPKSSANGILHLNIKDEDDCVIINNDNPNVNITKIINFYHGGEGLFIENECSEILQKNSEDNNMMTSDLDNKTANDYIPEVSEKITIKTEIITPESPDPTENIESKFFITEHNIECKLEDHERKLLYATKNESNINQIDSYGKCTRCLRFIEDTRKPHDCYEESKYEVNQNENNRNVEVSTNDDYIGVVPEKITIKTEITTPDSPGPTENIESTFFNTEHNTEFKLNNHERELLYATTNDSKQNELDSYGRCTRCLRFIADPSQPHDCHGELENEVHQNQNNQHQGNTRNERTKEANKSTESIICNECRRRFSSQSDLDKHMISHTMDKPFPCDECHKRFLYHYLLVRHKRFHSGEKPFECDECGLRFKHSSDVTRHKRKHTGERPYACDECTKTFTTRSYLVQHKRVHTGEKPYKCPECSLAFTQRAGLIIHKRLHTGERPYVCDVCQKTFSDMSILKKHKQIHTGEKLFKCDECDLEFAQRGGLNIHKRTHTGEKPYQCDECDKTFTQRSNLSTHKRVHTGEKPYKCDECGLGFTQSSDLNRHKRKHTGERPYPCDECDKSFTTRSYLIQHKRTHSGEKPFKCEECGLGFTLRGNLNTHMRTHTGEKPYACDECHKTFAQRSHVITHKRFHSGEKPYKCEECHLGFTQRSDLNRHICRHLRNALLQSNV